MLMMIGLCRPHISSVHAGMYMRCDATQNKDATCVNRLLNSVVPASPAIGGAQMRPPPL